MLHLLRTTLVFCANRELTWDPKTDIVFLCKTYPGGIKSIRAQLNEKELNQWFFVTPFYLGLSIEDQRRCSLALLGREFIQVPTSDVPTSPRFHQISPAPKASTKQPPRLSLQTTNFMPNQGERQPERLSIHTNAQQFRRQPTLPSSSFNVSPIETLSTVSCLNNSAKNTMTPEMRDGKGPLSYALPRRISNLHQLDHPRASNTANYTEKPNSKESVSHPTPSGRSRSVDDSSPSMQDRNRFPPALLPARYVRPASFDVRSSLRQETEQVGIRHLRNVSTPQVIHAQALVPIAAELNPSPGHSPTGAPTVSDAQYQPQPESVFVTRGLTQMKRWQAPKGHMERRKVSRSQSRSSSQDSWSSCVPTSPTEIRDTPLEQEEHYPVDASSLPTVLQAKQQTAPLKVVGPEGLYSLGFSNNASNTTCSSKAQSQPQQPPSVLDLPQALIAGPKLAPKQTQNVPDVLKAGPRPVMKQRTGSGQKKFMQGPALKPKVVKTKRSQTIRRQKSKHNLMMANSRNARMEAESLGSLSCKPVPSIPMSTQSTSQQQIIAPVVTQQATQQSFVIENYDWLPKTPRSGPAPELQPPKPTSTTSSATDIPTPSIQQEFSLCQRFSYCEDPTLIPSPLKMATKPKGTSSTPTTLKLDTKQTTTDTTTIPAHPIPHKKKNRLSISITTNPLLRQYAPFAHGPYSALDSPVSSSSIYRTIGFEAAWTSEARESTASSIASSSTSTSASSSPSQVWSVEGSSSSRGTSASFNIGSPVPESGMTDGSYYGIFGGEDGYDSGVEAHARFGKEGRFGPRRVDSQQQDA